MVSQSDIVRSLVFHKTAGMTETFLIFTTVKVSKSDTSQMTSSKSENSIHVPFQKVKIQKVKIQKVKIQYKCHFPKTQNYEFCTKTLDELI